MVYSSLVGAVDPSFDGMDESHSSLVEAIDLSFDGMDEGHISLVHAVDPPFERMGKYLMVHQMYSATTESYPGKYAANNTNKWPEKKHDLLADYMSF